MVERKKQFMQMLVELCHAYGVTYHDNCTEAFCGWDLENWSVTGEELEKAVNQDQG